MFNARMRAPMKSTASIGAKFMDAVAIIKAFSALLVKLAAMPVNWVHVLATWIPP
jgi:hypothetical protein